MPVPPPPAEGIYNKIWVPASGGGASDVATSNSLTGAVARGRNGSRNKASDDAKLLFGTVFSLRNMVRKLGGDDDAFVSYRTATYKLHYYETASCLRFVMLTDTATLSMRNVMHQIYINLWVEYGKSRRLFLFPQPAAVTVCRRLPAVVAPWHRC